MFQTVTKPLSAMALSLSLVLGAITLPATPARADGEDIAGVLFGLLALGAIAYAVNENNDRDNRRTVTPHATRNVTPHVPHRNLRVAPARCFRDFGAIRGYGARCMQQQVSRPGLLPPECIVRVQTDRGMRNLYAGRCLRRNGWEREAGFRP